MAISITNFVDLQTEQVGRRSGSEESVIDEQVRVLVSNPIFKQAVSDNTSGISAANQTALEGFGGSATIVPALETLAAAEVDSQKNITALKTVVNACADLPGKVAVWQETGSPNNNANGITSIVFRPSVFGMDDGEVISSITVRTRSNGSGTYAGGYVAIADAASAFSINAEDITLSTLPNYLTISGFNTSPRDSFDIEFSFRTAVKLEKDKQYRFVFLNSIWANPGSAPIPLRLIVGDLSPDLYITGTEELQNCRPIMTVKHYKTLGDVIAEELAN